MPRKIHVLSYDGPSISMWLIASKSTVLHAGSLRGGGGVLLPQLFREGHYLCFNMRIKKLCS